MLLGDRTGLPDVEPHLGSRPLEGWIDWMRRQPMRFAPGGSGRDRGDASNLLAGYLIAHASGASWITYLSRNIFRPLHMYSTGLDWAGAAGRATPYFRAHTGAFVPAGSFRPLSTPDVVYGLMSTVDDMYRFDTALHAGTLVPLKTLETTATGSRYGSDHDELGHGPHGTADGWYTEYTHRTAERLTILAFSNLGGYSLGNLERALFPATIDWPPPAIRLSDSELGHFVGRYVWYDSYRKRLETITVTRAGNGRLRLDSDILGPGRHEVLIAPTSKTTFYETAGLHGSLAAPGLTYTFERNASGAVIAVVTADKGSGRGARYRRVP